MEKFSDFISEQKNEQPYHLVALVYDAHNVRDVSDNQDKGGDAARAAIGLMLILSLIHI